MKRSSGLQLEGAQPLATGPMGTEIYPVIVEFVLGEQGTGPELCRGDLREIGLSGCRQISKISTVKIRP
jgi:hypothetical protein